MVSFLWMNSRFSFFSLWWPLWGRERACRQAVIPGLWWLDGGRRTYFTVALSTFSANSYSSQGGKRYRYPGFTFRGQLLWRLIAARPHRLYRYDARTHGGVVRGHGIWQRRRRRDGMQMQCNPLVQEKETTAGQ